MRLVVRIVFLLVVLALLATGGVLAWFTSWRTDRLAALDAESEVVETTLGPVECAVSGDGPAVLIFHGAPGGWDQAALIGADLVRAGFRVIAPSRPGYLRTPFASGLLPKQQADLMAALLDALEIRDVAVLGYGEGGPAAVEFAARHPGRTRGLILESAVTTRFDRRAPGEATEFGRVVLRRLTGDVGAWWAVREADDHPARALATWLPLTLRATPDEIERAAASIERQPEQLAWLRDMVATFAPLSPRESGTRNDLMVLQNLGNVSLDKVTVPALVLHGKHDRCAPIEEARRAAARLRTVQFFEAPTAGRWIPLSAEATEAAARKAAFLTGLSPTGESTVGE